jgi:flavin-dependent dehydrogenase
MRPPVIVGGGPAGAAAAIRLAEAGHAPILLERSTAATDKVCGDFLSAETVAALGTLGLDLPALCPAPISRMRLVHGRRMADSLLPFAALGLSRRVLDEALLNLAAARGVQVMRGQTVQGISANGIGISIRAREPIQATSVFLATGKHDLRGIPRRGAPHIGLHGGPIGLKTYFRLTNAQQAALAGCVELMLFPGGYAGLQPVESGAAVLCLLVERARFVPAGAWGGLLAALMASCPHLALRLDGATPLRDRPAAVANVPYGHLHRDDPRACEGLFRIGDQACVIPSLTGDGIAIALHSAILAADTWLGGRTAAEYHHRLAGLLGRQMRVAGVLHRICLNAAIQASAVAVTRSFPGLLRRAATWTRLPAALADVPTERGANDRAHRREMHAGAAGWRGLRRRIREERQRGTTHC